MTQRQRQISTNLVRLTMLTETMEKGESKVSKVQSRIISPTLVDIVKKDPLMIKACEIKGLQIEDLIEKATDIGFLKKGVVVIDDSSEEREVDLNDGTTK